MAEKLSKKELEQISKLRNDSELFLFDKIKEVGEKLDKSLLNPEVFFESIKGKDGLTPTDEELVELIRPLIPEPVDGVDGTTPTDKELLSIIKPLIPKIKDGKTPTRKDLLDLIKPLIPNVKDGVSPSIRDVADEAINRIKSKKKISVEDIKGLEKILKEKKVINAKDIKGIQDILPKFPPQYGGGSGASFLKSMRDVDLTGLSNNSILKWNVTTKKFEVGTVSAGSGDVVGPASATDTAIARYDTTTGKLIQDSTVLLSDVGDLDQVNSVQFDLTPTGLSHAEGQLHWNEDDGVLEVNLSGGNVSLQIGQENNLRVKNTSGSDMTNGQVVIITGATGSRPEVDLADADSIATSGVIGVLTEDIAGNQLGYVTTFGLVRDIDTSSVSAGQPIWLSQTSGEFTGTRPTQPAIGVVVGICLVSHATTGIIIVKTQNVDRLVGLSDVLISGQSDNDFIYWDNATSIWKNKQLGTSDVTNLDGFLDFYNGTFKETFDALVTSDGAIITMSLEQSGTGDLTMRYSDGLTTLDCTPAQTIALTAGSDSAPQANYIYIPQSTKVLTKSTTGFPTTSEHIRVGYFFVPSATFVQSDGCYVNQNWNDHAANGDNQGHMAHIAQKIRRLGAGYFSGIDANGAESYLTIVGTTVDFKSTSGVIAQTHDHTFPAFDTSTGGKMLVHNWSGDSFHAITNLYDIVADSTGTTIANNQYFNLIVGGVANKSGEYEPVMINLPSGTYTTQLGAERDLDSFDDFQLPRQFGIDSSTGFYICRLTVQKKATTWEWKSTVDLRGTTPQSARGATSASVTQYPDNQFAVFDETDITKVMDFDVGTNVPTGTTKTVIMANTDVDLSDIATNNAKVTYPSADSTKVGHISVTQAVDLDTMESDITTNNSKISYTDSAKVAGIEALADVTDTANVTAAGALMDSEVDADIKTLTIAASSSISGSNTGDEVSATTTTEGVVERSTSAENVTGTSDTVYPTVAGTKEMIDTHAGGGGGTWDLIGENTVSTVTSTLIDISSISTDYDIFKITFAIKANAANIPVLRLNNDATNTYTNQSLNSNNTTTTSARNVDFTGGIPLYSGSGALVNQEYLTGTITISKSQSGDRGIINVQSTYMDAAYAWTPEAVSIAGIWDKTTSKITRIAIVDNGATSGSMRQTASTAIIEGRKIA